MAEVAGATIKIDRDIPVPFSARGPYARGIAVTLRALEIGESFVFPVRPENKTPLINSASRLACAVGKKTGRRFTCRTVTENGERVVRIWRIA